MKNGFLVCGLWLSLFAGAGRTEVQVSTDQDDDVYYEQDQTMVWIGPGWYYGIWFSNEYDYNHWNYNHHHRYEPYDHHDGNRHHDGENHHHGDQGGGHHGGGGHGGGHR